MTQLRLLITDLDNTLYDWVTYFARSFYAMVDAAEHELGVNREELLDDLQQVHRAHHNTEQPFSLLEAPVVRRCFPGVDRHELAVRCAPAFEAFGRTRDMTLKLYPHVADTLQVLGANGVTVVAHTEATVPNALYRLRRLGIERHFDAIFALEPSGLGHPSAERNALLLHSPKHLHFLRHDERKPNPDVVRDICKWAGVGPAETVYVGDSLTRDVGMASSAGARSAWARYGTKFSPDDWQRIVRVSHWSPADIDRAERARREYSSVEPTAILEDHFGQMLDRLPFTGGALAR